MVKEIKSKTKTIHFTDVKRFVKHLNYRTYIIQLATFIFCIILIALTTACFINEIRQIRLSEQKILHRLDKIEKKIDFRYYNTTRSLEEIHKVKIDTQSGYLRR